MTAFGGQAATSDVGRAELRILRDEYGVPHIFADTTYGVFFGFGYALAEDQLYQVEILKRTARGRVAEVLGRSYLASDNAARTRIDIASLERQFNTLQGDDRAIFEGMTDGLNARVAVVLAHRDMMLPNGFIEANFLPEEWTPLDVLAVYAHSMVNRFSDINGELDNLALLTRLRRDHGAVAGWKLFEQLRWANDEQAPTSVSEAEQRAQFVPTFAAPARGEALPNRLVELSETVLHKASQTSEPAHASNAWIASPGRTGTGETVLVNGPQMGHSAASYIWAVGLHGAGFNLVGSGPVGSPWLIFGTNGDIGWGATAGLGDTVDVYQERLDSQNIHRYRYKSHWLSMARRDESINVRDGTPATLSVWSTVHGVVALFDDAQHVAYSRRRTWAGSEVQSLVASVRSMQASDYPTWRRQVAKVAISVNNYYVDRRGNIGYQFLGSFPVRPRDQDFRLPAIGDGSMEWSGLHSTLDNPFVLNPSSGFLTNWNNKPQPRYANTDFMYWSRVDRVREIQDIAGHGTLNADALWKLVERSSFSDVTARYFIELVRAHRATLEQRVPEATRMIADWDGELADRAAARAEPAYVLYQEFMHRLLVQLFAPVLPRSGPGREAPESDLVRVDPVFPSMGAKIAYVALSSSNDSPLLGGRRPPDLLLDALAEGWKRVIEKYGSNPSIWTVPATPHDFANTNYAGVPIARETDSVSLPIFMNRGTENDRIVFKDGRVTFCDVTPPGQSGFVAPDGTLSPHGRDQLSIYGDFGCKSEWLTEADVNTHAASSELVRYAQPLSRIRRH